ncbi:MAG: transcription elongation factor GreA [Tissierellia bacterium]|nr:transcription elongation factor GreA [Tissierellia bacterium]
MNDTKVLITKEGLEKLKTELEYLKTQKRAEVAEKIRVARGFGDLSENAEYDEAKAEQAKVESRISQIEIQIKNAEIIQDKKNSKTQTVSIGDTVKIHDIKRDKELTLSIVGTVEADLTKNKISNESPVGKALIGRKKNDVVEVVTKIGAIEYKILEIIR